ncbi:hypothetical protein [Reichenbachiella ulvae]|uniref:Uncharacterized protein n=1 Tax=Reichenbachiella ulvae TaxID=2980104 RepID=A0ABT3CQ53_9BACT|nr:hypothetical protein [Reichenbachiella ulvae]MCV9385856.1 hypothetical protein [Reichenbachiella ulvae]
MRRSLWLIFCLFGVHCLYGQESNIHHEVPSSPAFAILDFEPTSVLRPTSPSELTTQLMSSFDENGKLNPNIGLEFAPYWLQSKPSLTYEQYVNPGTWQTMKQTFRISFANVQDTALNQSFMGAGFRFQLLQGHLSDETIAAVEQVRSRASVSSLILAMRAMAMRFKNKKAAIDQLLLNLTQAGYDQKMKEELMKVVLEIDDNYTTDASNDVSEIRAFAEQINEAYLSKNIDEKLIEQTRERVGLIIELGGASSFQTKQVGQEGGIRKLGFWATASEKINEDNQFVFSARYMSSTLDSVASNFDLGLSFVKDVDNISLSFEGVARWYEVQFMDLNSTGQPINRVEEDFTYRLAINANYQLSKSIFVSASLGRNYANGITQESGFFSILGINYNLFRPMDVDVK